MPRHCNVFGVFHPFQRKFAMHQCQKPLDMIFMKIFWKGLVIGYRWTFPIGRFIAPTMRFSLQHPERGVHLDLVCRTLFSPRRSMDTKPALSRNGMWSTNIQNIHSEKFGKASRATKGGLFKEKPFYHYWLVVSNIFYFHPYLGKVSILTNIFQTGWNRQLD